MSSHNEPTALAHCDRSTPPLLLNNCSQNLNLVGAVPVRIFGIGTQLGRIHKRSVGAMDGHASKTRVNS